MNRLVSVLERSREADRLSLVGYLPAGWPSRDDYAECVQSAFDGGADALEIGLPNPPMPLDGPLIQHATQIGAGQVDGPQDALRLARDAAPGKTATVIALAYRQAFDEFGVDGLLRVCRDGGADALLLPQHPVAEQLAIAVRARAAGLEQVIFLHLEEDLPLFAASGLERPVIYLQSADLRTGGRFDRAKAHERLGEVRAALAGADAYILVGFGIRGPAEVSQLAGTSADGAIVGTAMVEAAGGGPEVLRSLVDDIRPALPKRFEPGHGGAVSPTDS